MRLRCAITGPDAGPRGYALTELLRGLGLAPEWTGPETADLVAGPDAARPEALYLPIAADARLDRSPDPALVEWLEHGGRRTPLPVEDILGAAFWWLAGVQETATVGRDAHGRFPFAASLQHALGSVETAPVDALRAWLGDALRARGHAVPGRTWGGAPWAVALTHDLDAVETPRARAFAGELLRRQPRRALVRGLGPDARRRSLGALEALARHHGARSTLFVKTVEPGSPEDVPYRVRGRLRTRLRRLAADGFEIGLHPGYASHDHAWRLAAERARLAAALAAVPTAVRSHFLRWSEPTTPRLYAQAGFAIDSTLGFAEAPGFRRGTTHPFRLWDAAGRVSDLWELPLAAMDTTLFTHRGLSDGAAEERLAAVFAEARRWGGVAVVLWHPAMDADPAWPRRLGVLDRALAEARRGGARIGPLGELLRLWTASQPSP